MTNMNIPGSAVMIMFTKGNVSKQILTDRIKHGCRLRTVMMMVPLAIGLSLLLL